MPHYPDHRYEILWVTQKHELDQHVHLVDEFFKLYVHPSNFPDPDELEEPLFIRDRIANGSDLPHTHLMLYRVILPDGERIFVGGCIVEFYPDSACGLITYLFVDQAWRGIGIGSRNEKVGESLISDENGLKGLVKLFETRYGKKVNAVFFESNNPAETLAENDSIPPIKRLRFFDRMGARRVAFNYIQPPLGDDKGIVTNLFLLTFPVLTGLPGTISALVVMRFVMELARSLDQNKQSDSGSLYGSENYAHDVHELAQKPGNPSLKGLVAEGRNIILETYHELARCQTDTGLLALISSVK